MRIYVASLSDYNAGELHGVWIDLETHDMDQTHAAIQAMLEQSEEEDAEEWAIHDYDGDLPECFGECSRLEEIFEYVEFMEEVGNDKLAKGIYEHAGDLEEAKTIYSDAYCGEHASIEDYAHEFVESTGVLEGASDLAERYFDYDAFARDMELGGDIWTIETGHREVHVFNSQY